MIGPEVPGKTKQKDQVWNYCKALISVIRRSKQQVGVVKYFQTMWELKNFPETGNKPQSFQYTLKSWVCSSCPAANSVHLFSSLPHLCKLQENRLAFMQNVKTAFTFLTAPLLLSPWIVQWKCTATKMPGRTCPDYKTCYSEQSGKSHTQSSWGVPLHGQRQSRASLQLLWDTGHSFLWPPVM